jgi:hypothetical protein
MIARTALALALALTAGPAAATDDPDALWPLLAQVRISETEEAGVWMALKTFPAELESLTDRVTVAGYPVLVLPEAQVTAFMLVQDSEDCPFCGSGNGYGPSLEVELARPVDILDPTARHVVTGRLELVRDPETWQAVRMVDARVTPE